MKLKLIFVAFISFLLIQAACRKDKTIDPHNQNLRDKTIDYIRAKISGDWYLEYGIICGINGCQPSYSSPGQQDIVSFLANDTIRQTDHMGQIIYFKEKTIVYRICDPNYLDSVFVFQFQNSSRAWNMQQIKNDTLVVNDGSQATFFLTKKL